MTVVLFYIISLFVSMILLMQIVIVSKHRNNMHFVFFCVLASVSLFGYLTIARANTLSVAIVGMQLTYVGRCYLEFVALMILYSFCNLKPSKLFYIPLVSLCTLTLFSTFCIGENNLFIKDLKLLQTKGFSYVEYQNGPLIYVFYAQVIFLFILFVLASLYAIQNKNRVAYSNCWRVIGLMSIAVVSFLIDCFLDVEVKVYPFSYILMELLLALMVRTMHLYDIDSNIVNYVLQQRDYGYIFVDMKRNYLGSNYAAQKMLPQLKTLSIGSLFAKKSVAATDKLSEWLDEFDDLISKEESVHRLTDNTRTFGCIIRPLMIGENKKQFGYTIVIYDDSQQQRYIHLLNDYNSVLEEKVQEKIEHIEDMQNRIVISMANIVENRDFSTGDHIKRTSNTVKLFVEYLDRMKPELHISDTFAENVWRAAPMHDLGKLSIRDYILTKPGKFTAEEYDEMKTHSEKGAQIVKQVLEDIEEPEFLEVAVNIAHYHHEKWDGSGYPEGLKGEEIPLEARIMALADVFDALVSERCYKEAMDYDSAFQVIQDSLGTHFDPVLGKCFTECKNELIELYELENASA